MRRKLELPDAPAVEYPEPPQEEIPQVAPAVISPPAVDADTPGPGGAPLVRFDADRRQNYHVEGGRRVYHGVPAGFAFDANGVLRRKE